MSHASFATIKAEETTFYSKFTITADFKSMWNPPKKIGYSQNNTTIPVTFNTNSNVSIPKFWSDPKGLTLLYDEVISGYTSFCGTICDGRIFLKTEKGPITIKGPIHGSPSEGQTFVGSGTWVQG
ncbi:hypothetical protein K443DRAFT_656675 [Laccaria amethystina LaAM-08-1]|uniref:Uncharacterized protein n=1 Tax=Laccaria amethystina LaAM-08-1 TaxID=1095629 RepID=A0A0C9Y3Q3_9AGAR|nr:hypothetical protein K443DRAFT_656675 [Laccaria amethystina LaAM-08-1]